MNRSNMRLKLVFCYALTVLLLATLPLAHGEQVTIQIEKPVYVEGELVKLSGAGPPMMAGAMQIDNPKGSPLVLKTVRTNAEGIYSSEFKLPSGYGQYGEYRVYVTFTGETAIATFMVMPKIEVPPLNATLPLQNLTLPTPPNVTIPVVNITLPSAVNASLLAWLMPVNITQAPFTLSGLMAGNITNLQVYVDNRLVLDKVAVNATGGFNALVPLATTGRYIVKLIAQTPAGSIVLGERPVTYEAPPVEAPKSPPPRLAGISIQVAMPKLHEFTEVALGQNEVAHITVEGVPAFSFQWQALAASPPALQIIFLAHRTTAITALNYIDGNINTAQDPSNIATVIWWGVVTMEEKAIFIIDSERGLPSATVEPATERLGPDLGTPGFAHAIYVSTEPGRRYLVSLDNQPAYYFEWNYLTIEGNRTVPQITVYAMSGEVKLTANANQYNRTVAGPGGSTGVGFQLIRHIESTTQEGDPVVFTVWRLHSTAAIKVTVGESASTPLQNFNITKPTWDLGELVTVTFRPPRGFLEVNPVLAPGKLNYALGERGWLKEYSEKDNLYTVRFTPTEPGAYTVTVTVMAQSGMHQGTISFTVEPTLLHQLGTYALWIGSPAAAIVAGVFLGRRYMRKSAPALEDYACPGLK